ncbi:MAG: hypothetical protein AB1633_13030, partial [Elusimicrobiota bacterium]
MLLDRFGPQGWWPTTVTLPHVDLGLLVDTEPCSAKKSQVTDYKIHDSKQHSLVPVYHPGRKSALTESEKFEICAGAILTQNTAWKNVEKAIEFLNKNKMMNPQKIAASSLTSLSCLIKSSGFFKQKAIKLKKFSEYLLKNHPEGISEW